MTPELFERLLHEDEGVTLDFKVGQYAFSGADELQKSELLKDILGFVNAWRRGEAYILIGVREVRGGRSEVVGIATDEHLDDHSLQQFVHAKTNRRVRFSYEAFPFDGKQIGIITIKVPEWQEWPVWLTGDYGKLNKEKVYVRYGSSTDPTKPATPDEILKMKEASKPQAASLEVQFGDVENDTAIGTSFQIKADFFNFPSKEDIPSLQLPRKHLPPVLDAMDQFHQEVVDPDYYRKMAHCAHHRYNFHPFRFVITNCGEVPAADVRLELQTPTESGIEILEESEIKTSLPVRSRSRWDMTSPAMDQIAFRRTKRFDGAVDVATDSAVIKIEVEYGKIQPGRQVATDNLFVACKESGTVTFRGQVLSKNLPKPIAIELTIEFDIAAREADLEQFLDWADKAPHMEEE